MHPPQDKVPVPMCPVAGGNGSSPLIRTTSVMPLRCETMLQVVSVFYSSSRFRFIFVCACLCGLTLSCFTQQVLTYYYRHLISYSRYLVFDRWEPSVSLDPSLLCLHHSTNTSLLDLDLPRSGISPFSEEPFLLSVESGM